MADGNGLADHPAHGDADDVGPADVEVVEQRDGVVSHVVERVRGVGQSPRGDAEHHLPAGGDRRVDLRRETDIAVVEADHPEAALHEALDELQRPCDELPAETHDEQEGFGVGVAVDLVLEGDAVHVGRSHASQPTGA